MDSRNQLNRLGVMTVLGLLAASGCSRYSNPPAPANQALNPLTNETQTSVVPAAPAGLTYTVSSAVYSVGQAITPNVPASTGGPVAGYSVNPALPAGLSLNPVTGVLSGTPLVAAAQGSYVVTASNAGGQTTAALTLTVQVTAYATVTAVYDQNVLIAPNGPVGGLTGTTYTVAPALPAGLNLDGSTGIISGAPTELAQAAAYTVSGAAPDGASTTALTFSVQAAPAALETWTTGTAPMATARTMATATLLRNGKVLVAGGADVNGKPLAAAEIYDPGAGTWTATGSLGAARCGHCATLLADGTVLVAGGASTGPLNATPTPLAAAECYDPASGTWTTGTPAMGTARFNPLAILLQNGTVLVAGGQDGNGHALASAEVYGKGAWTPVNGMASGHLAGTATLLANGTVLVTGGLDGSGNVLATTELYGANGWSAGPSLGGPRQGHSASMLSDGTVLVAGGQESSGAPLATTESYGSGAWTPGPALTTARTLATATLLPDDRLMVAGGLGANGGALASVEFLTEGAWDESKPVMGSARARGGATLLPSGTVLMTGGDSGTTVITPMAAVEIFVP